MPSTIKSDASLFNKDEYDAEPAAIPSDILFCENKVTFIKIKFIVSRNIVWEIALIMFPFILMNRF